MANVGNEFGASHNSATDEMAQGIFNLAVMSNPSESISASDHNDGDSCTLQIIEGFSVPTDSSTSSTIRTRFPTLHNTTTSGTLEEGEDFEIVDSEHQVGAFFMHPRDTLSMDGTDNINDDSSSMASTAQHRGVALLMGQNGLDFRNQIVAVPIDGMSHEDNGCGRVLVSPAPLQTTDDGNYTVDRSTADVLLVVPGTAVGNEDADVTVNATDTGHNLHGFNSHTNLSSQPRYAGAIIISPQLITSDNPNPRSITIYNRFIRFSILMACNLVIIVAFVIARSLFGEDYRNGTRDIVLRTLSPTITNAPSGTPNFINLFGLELPENTIKSLRDSSSPQARALSWLVEENVHLQTYTKDQALQRFLLATLYYSCGRDTALHSQFSECDWDAVSCNEYHECTSIVSWCQMGSDFKLWGGLPPELGLLTNLTKLRLLKRFKDSDDSVESTGTGIDATPPSNKLLRTIPKEIRQLTNLESIHLGTNWMTGSIPVEIGQLTNIQWLELSLNILTGQIPPELGRLTNIGSVALHSNQLTGAIPTEVGKLINLYGLRLHSNKLNATIPTEIGLLRNLLWASLGANQLQGTLPSEIGGLHNIKELHLESNSLSGTLPSHMGQLSQLTSLWIYDNAFRGPMPAELCHLNLTELRGTCTKQFPCQCCTHCCGNHTSCVPNR